MEYHKTYYKYLLSRTRWGYLYRRYWLYPKLCKHLKGITLDVGCGIGDMLSFRPNTTGVDINPHTINYCKSLGLDAVRMDQNNIPFNDEHFDSVLLDNVLEHIEKPASLLMEVRRVLIKKGILVVGVPGIKGYNSDPDHKVAYNESSLVKNVSRNGFQINKIFCTPFFHSSILSKYLKQYCVYGIFIKKG